MTSSTKLRGIIDFIDDPNKIERNYMTKNIKIDVQDQSDNDDD